MNIKSYFTEIWQEKDWWKSILLTGLISLIPILGQIYLLGWLFEIYSLNHTPKRAMLPFTPTVKIFLNGLWLAIGVLIYFIPFLILSGALGLLANFFYWTEIGWFSTLIFNLLVFIRNISFLVGILTLLLILPILIITYDQRKSIADFFRVNHILKSIAQNLQTLATFFVLSVLAIFIASLGGSFLMIGFIFTVPFAAAFYGNALSDLSLITVSEP